MKTKSKKITVAIVGILLLGATVSKAQWGTSSAPNAPLVSGYNNLIGATTLSGTSYIIGNTTINSGAVQLNTNSGNMLLGPTNTTYCHFETNVGFFWFNKPVTFNELTSYEGNDLSLETGNWGSGGTTRMIIKNGGLVGIGTTNPGYVLDVNGTINSSSLINAVSVFTLNTHNATLSTDQGAAIELGGDNAHANTGNKTPYIDFHYGNSTIQDYNMRIVNGADGRLDFNTGYLGGNTTVMSIIGNANGNYIRVPEVRVCTNGCDFVFEKGYKLMGLDELDKYVTENHHLPGIAPAADMQANGMGLSQTVSDLLQKVEELTLYTIQQQKEIQELKEKLEANTNTAK